MQLSFDWRRFSTTWSWVILVDTEPDTQPYFKMMQSELCLSLNMDI